MGIQYEKSNKGLKTLIVLLLIVSICLGGSTYYFYNFNSKKEEPKCIEEDTKENEVKPVVKDLSLLSYVYDYENESDLIELGTYSYDDKEYKLSIETKDKDVELEDGSVITEYAYYLNINDKSVEIDVDGIISVSAFDYDTSLIYVNGIGSFSYNAACVIDIEEAKLVKSIEGGYITGNNVLIGIDWNNFQTYSVCTGGSNGKYSIRGFDLEDPEYDVLISSEIDAHCFQED